MPSVVAASTILDLGFLASDIFSVASPQLLYFVTKKAVPEDLAVGTKIPLSQEAVIYQSHGFSSDPDILDPLEEEGSVLITCIPSLGQVGQRSWALPMGCSKAGLQANKVCDTLDKTRGWVWS